MKGESRSGRGHGALRSLPTRPVLAGYHEAAPPGVEVVLENALNLVVEGERGGSTTTARRGAVVAVWRDGGGSTGARRRRSGAERRHHAAPSGVWCSAPGMVGSVQSPAGGAARPQRATGAEAGGPGESSALRGGLGARRDFQHDRGAGHGAG